MSNPYKEGTWVTLPSGKRVFVRRKPGGVATQRQRENRALRRRAGVWGAAAGLVAYGTLTDFTTARQHQKGINTITSGLKKLGVKKGSVAAELGGANAALKNLKFARNVHVAFGLLGAATTYAAAKAYLDYKKVLVARAKSDRKKKK